MNDLDRTSLQVHSRSSSPYDWSTCSELYPEAETTQPGQRGTTRVHTHRAHAWQRRHDTTASLRLRRGAGRRSCRAPAAAAAVAAAAAAAAVLLLLCCSCTAAAASRSAMHRGAQRATTDCFSFFFSLFWNARLAQQQQQQEQHQGRPKHLYTVEG